ncbi:MAG: hypothetical protein HYR63_06885 [Proteobacteria bacterium]|nr:hypothetical protein [Pseudomonadota bacterium]
MRGQGTLAVLLALILGAGALAQPASGPSEQSLKDAVRLGGIATLAPLCGVREEPWAFDLRRAAMQSATGTDATEDGELKAAPGSNLAIAALGYADLEALEDFALDHGEASCEKLRQDPDLARADRMVDEFRRRAQLKKPVG